MVGESTMDSDEEMSQPHTNGNIWQVLENSVAANRSTASTPASDVDKPSETEKAERKRAWRRWRRIADVIAAMSWVYVVCKLLFFDIDRAIVEAVAPGQSWLLTYRALAIAGLVAIVATFLWRMKTLLLLGYVLVFPLIVVGWKLPKCLYRRRSWIVVLGVINAIGLVARNLRYTLITKGAAIIAGAAIVISGSPPLLIVASGYLLGLLLWSSARTIRRTLQANWFLRVQSDVIERVTGSKLVRDITSVDERVRRGEIAVLNSTELATVTNALSFSIISSRGLYFWAYQLQRYREARLNVLFNLVTYVWLFAGALITLWLTNIALLKIDPAQFDFGARPSNVAMLLYSLAILALNETSGLTSAGDVAHLIRIGAGLYGLLFLAVFVVTLLFSWRQQRDESSLTETVSTLKAKAREQEALLREQYDVGVDEALFRLEQLGQGFIWFVGLLTSAIPSEFLDDEV